MSRRSALAMDEAAQLFAALGDRTRLALVHRLGSEGPLSIARLSEGQDVTRQAVTKHLQALEDAGLVAGDKRGRERVWSLEAKRLSEARKYLDKVGEQWDAAIDRLRDLVED